VQDVFAGFVALGDGDDLVAGLEPAGRAGRAAAVSRSIFAAPSSGLKTAPMPQRKSAC